MMTTGSGSVELGPFTLSYDFVVCKDGVVGFNNFMLRSRFDIVDRKGLDSFTESFSSFLGTVPSPRGYSSLYDQMEADARYDAEDKG